MLTIDVAATSIRFIRLKHHHCYNICCKTHSTSTNNGNSIIVAGTSHLLILTEFPIEQTK